MDAEVSRQLSELRAISESAVIGLVRVRNRTIMWANAAFCSMFGYAPGEVVGLPSRRFYVTEADYEVFANDLRVAVEKGSVFKTEVRQRRKDGSIGWFDFSASRLLPSSDELLGALVDVTGRHEASDALAASEARLREAQSLAKIGSWEVELPSGALTWSEEMYRLYGLYPHGPPLTAESGLSHVHPDDRQETARAYASARQAARPLELTHRIVGADGEERTVHVRGVVVHDGAGVAARLVGTAQDITERVRHEREVAARNAQREGAFAAMAEGLVLQNADGTIVAANPAASRVLRLTREQLLGRTSIDPSCRAIHEDGSPFPGSEHPAMVALRTSRPVRGQVMGVSTSDRDVRWISINAQPIHLPDVEKPTGVVSTFVDVTDAKRAAEEQQALIRQLTQTSESLRESESRLRAVTDNIPVTVALFDADETIRFANREFRKLGRIDEDPVGLPAGQYLQEGLAQSSKEPRRRALAGETVRFTASAVIDGAVYHREITYLPHRDASGIVDGVFGLGYDVTELQESYRRIQELAERLASVRERERNELAVRLHEGLAQDLFGVQLSLRRLELAGKGQDAVLAVAKDLSDLIRQCITDVRNVTGDLYPAALRLWPVDQAIAQHAANVGNRAKLRIQVSCPRDFPQLGADAKLLFFRAAQEALTNVARHAQASTVTIRLDSQEDRIALVVEDDGVGIAVGDLSKPGSVGLLGMRERFRAAGGDVTVERRDPKGTRLIAFIRQPEATARLG